MATAFNVYLYGKLIDTVYFSKDTNVDEVRYKLIEHDYYDSDIKVVKARKLRKK